jgi:hypothetical protein
MKSIVTSLIQSFRLPHAFFKPQLDSFGWSAERFFVTFQKLES